MTEEATTKARRGDLAVLLMRSTTTHLSEGRQTSERVEIGTVTSVTREGTVKAVAIPFSRTDLDPQSLPLRSRHGVTSVLLVPADEIDTEAALSAYREHRWNDESEMIKPLDSIAQAREMLRPFRKGGGDGGKG